jgi:hypothetical protein
MQRYGSIGWETTGQLLKGYKMPEKTMFIPWVSPFLENHLKFLWEQ